jgi:SAM-dependent methyltransferase
MSNYTPKFFTLHEQGSERSAARMVPELLTIFRPRSVIDVGCGTGAWIAEFMKQGVTDVVGVDGDYVRTEQLKIHQQHFLVRDLLKPLMIGRTFDLAVSLEVAEHLPESRSTGFISELVQLAPVVLLSAAITLQGGTFHINEQWPDYWEAIFRQHDYVTLDCLRCLVWDDESVDLWYRQNTILYVSTEFIKNDETFFRISIQQRPRVLRMVHPRLYEQRNAAALNPDLRVLIRSFPRALGKTASRLGKRLSSTVRWRSQ